MHESMKILSAEKPFTKRMNFQEKNALVVDINRNNNKIINSILEVVIIVGRKYIGG